LLAFFVSIPYALSLPFFALAGRSYKQFKIKEAKEKALAEAAKILAEDN
jgi:hypothetical protein